MTAAPGITHPHLPYGDCDGFGPGNTCSVCSGLLERDDGSVIRQETGEVVVPSPPRIGPVASHDNLRAEIDRMRECLMWCERRLEPMYAERVRKWLEETAHG